MNIYRVNFMGRLIGSIGSTADVTLDARIAMSLDTLEILKFSGQIKTIREAFMSL